MTHEDRGIRIGSPGVHDVAIRFPRKRIWSRCLRRRRVPSAATKFKLANSAKAPDSERWRALNNSIDPVDQLL